MATFLKFVGIGAAAGAVVGAICFFAVVLAVFYIYREVG